MAAGPGYNLWVACRGSVFDVSSGGVVTTVASTSGLVRAMVTARDGDLWMVGNQGLMHRRPDGTVDAHVVGAGHPDAITVGPDGAVSFALTDQSMSHLVRVAIGGDPALSADQTTPTSIPPRGARWGPRRYTRRPMRHVTLRPGVG